MQGCQFFLCLLCNRVVPSCFFDKVFRLRHSPPHGGGVDATSTKYREASFGERPGWSLTSHISECVLNMACERPHFLMAAPYRACAGSARRLRRFGGFAIFSYCRSHPSSGRLWEEGSIPPENCELNSYLLRITL